MVAFSERSLCYQVGMLLLLLATSVFAAGVALPWWAQTRARGSEEITSHSGLWLGCTSSTGEEKCSTIDAPNWFRAVQALQCMSLAGMLAACAYAIFTNCCLDHATFSRTMEIAAGVGGVLGIVSTILYVVKTSHILRVSPDASYSWAFGMDVAACVFVTFDAAIIALTNSRHPGDPGSHFIVEEGSSLQHHYRRPHRPSGLRGKQREWEMEMTPVRTPKMPATPGGRTEVIVMQNNCCTDSPQKYVRNGTNINACTALSGTVHACHPTWDNAAVSSASGREESAQARSFGHDHCCKTPCSSSPKYLPDCPSDLQKTVCSSRKLPAGPLPRPQCNASCDVQQFSNRLPLASVAPCRCSGPNPQAQHESQYYQQDTLDFVNEKCSGKEDRDLLNYPRVAATAPPLSLQSEYEYHGNYATTHYFGNVDTVCGGDEDVESGK